MSSITLAATVFLLGVSLLSLLLALHIWNFRRSRRGNRPRRWRNAFHFNTFWIRPHVAAAFFSLCFGALLVYVRALSPAGLAALLFIAGVALLGMLLALYVWNALHPRPADEPKRGWNPSGRHAVWRRPLFSAVLIVPCLGIVLISVPASRGQRGVAARIPSPEALPSFQVRKPGPAAPELPKARAPVENCDPISLSEAKRIATEAARREGVPPQLLIAVIFQESRFRPCAVSTSGAKGLMQLAPITAEDLGIRNPFDPGANIHAGARYLRRLLARYRGDIPLALGAYRIGPGVIDRLGGFPPGKVPREYVRDVMAMADALADD